MKNFHYIINFICITCSDVLNKIEIDTNKLTISLSKECIEYLSNYKESFLNIQSEKC